MKQIPRWAADSFSLRQDVSRISRKTKFNCHFQHLSQINPVQATTLELCKPVSIRYDFDFQNTSKSNVLSNVSIISIPYGEQS